MDRKWIEVDYSGLKWIKSGFKWMERGLQGGKVD